MVLRVIVACLAELSLYNAHCSRGYMAWHPTAHFSLLLPGQWLSSHLHANGLAGRRSLSVIIYRLR